jgi:hypothetical protein
VLSARPLETWPARQPRAKAATVAPFNAAPPLCTPLQDKYLQGRVERMRRILSEATAAADVMAAAAAAPPGASPPPPPPSGPLGGAAGAPAREAWGFGPEGGPPALGAFVTMLGDRLGGALQETVVNVSSIFLQVGRAGKPLRWRAACQPPAAAAAGFWPACSFSAPHARTRIHASRRPVARVPHPAHAPPLSPLTHAPAQDDPSAARRKPLVKVAKDVTGEYFRLVRWARGAAYAAAGHGVAEPQAGLPATSQGPWLNGLGPPASCGPRTRAAHQHRRTLSGPHRPAT